MPSNLSTASLTRLPTALQHRGRRMHRSCGWAKPPSSDLGLRLQDLPAAIHARLQIDVVRAAKLSGILVFDIGRPLQGVGRAAHAASRGRGFPLRHRHGFVLLLIKQNARSWRRLRFSLLGSRAYRGRRKRKLGAYSWNMPALRLDPRVAPVSSKGYAPMLEPSVHPPD